LPFAARAAGEVEIPSLRASGPKEAIRQPGRGAAGEA
jgi:hypothetical protein